MADVGYSEKQFETYINAALMHSSNCCFTPNTYEEKYFGFDAAHCINPAAFGLLGQPIGIDADFHELTGVDIHQLEAAINHRMDANESLIANSFLQYKKPARIKTAKGAQWSLWGEPYYRFPISVEQQVTLSALEREVSDRAWVGYAAPALPSAASLNLFNQLGALISHTNFQRASNLDGHDYYTYVSGGGTGQACSEPEIVRSATVPSFADEVLSHLSPISPAKNLLVLEKGLLAASERFPIERVPVEDTGEPRLIEKPAFFDAVQRRRETFPSETPLLRALASVSLFMRWHSLEWVMYAQEVEET